MFITLEGIEGSGKTTQVKNIVAFLKTRGYDCVTTREPGGTAIGSRIRGILLHPENKELVPEAELLLYVADRVQHIRTVIEPSLTAGRVVVCDRFFDATLVYQGYARGLDKELIQTLHQLTCGGLTPALTVLFDLDPTIGLSRAWRRINSGAGAGKESRFEQEKIAFHKKVRTGYLTLSRLAPERFRVIDAAKSENQVAEDVRTVLTSFFSAV